MPINSDENTASNTCVTKAATDPAQTIETSVGQAFCIVISSNITTGYTWEYLPSLDSNKVELIEKHYQPPETNRLGAAGMEFLTFRAQENGKVEISLIYRRSWQTNEQPVMTRKFNVLIKSM